MDWLDALLDVLCGLLDELPWPTRRRRNRRKRGR